MNNSVETFGECISVCCRYLGLTMFVNEEEVGAHKTHGTDIEPIYDYDRSTVFGKAMSSMISER